MGDPRGRHAALIALAERQHGVVAREQWQDIGVDTHHRRRLVSGGEWRQPTPRILVRTGSPATTEQKVSAAVLDAGPGAHLSHGSACAWWGHRGSPFLPAEVVTTSRSHRRGTLAVVHPVRLLPDEWVCTINGVRVVRAELVALHLFATQHPQRAARLADSMWSQGVLSGRTVGHLLAEMATSGRNGIVGLRQWHDERGDDYRPPDSGRESRFMQLAERAGVPMGRQVNTGDERGWIGRVDFRHPSLPLVVEVQSDFWHSSVSDRADDRARLRRMREAGYVVVEITDDQLFREGALVVQILRDARRRAAAVVRS